MIRTIIFDIGNVLTVFGMIGVSIPQFFFGMLCILVFALDWAILPIGSGRLCHVAGIPLADVHCVERQPDVDKQRA